MEKALVKYKIKSDLNSTTSLLRDEQKEDVSFYLLNNKPKTLPFLAALLSQDEFDGLLPEQPKTQIENESSL
jgi:hypothetical protein